MKPKSLHYFSVLSCNQPNNSNEFKKPTVVSLYYFVAFRQTFDCLIHKITTLINDEGK